jgi:hypothetical protein
MEFVVTPGTTFILFENAMPRRIYTDGRAWPKNVEPAFVGYSIGQWIDDDGDGRYDALVIETRNLKGPAGLRGERAAASPRQSDHRQGAHSSQRDQQEHPDRRGHDHRRCADRALDGDQDLSPRIQSVLVREQLHREQSARLHRPGRLLRQRRRLPDAGQEGPVAAQPEVFQGFAVTSRV